MQVESQTLNAAIGKVLHAAADEPARPILNTILFEGDADGLRLAAADNYRVAVADVTNEDASSLGRIAVALDEIPTLRAFLAKRKRNIVIERDGLHLVASDPYGRVVVRLVDGMWPNYRPLLDTGAARTTVVINAAYLLDALKALAKTGATRFELPVVTGEVTSNDTARISAAGYTEVIMPIRAALSGVDFGSDAAKAA